ncbi:hypothetical protein RHSIM_RhsimUnG0239600 [Rhododendron simsii]|uniref:DUF4283 domain-containing protein n=1 Tax=Rhododendron simsii TaxID=118357 RepID=A0A834FTC9_RHOSS|nr:hypothetical protein RHSIM_RhsimUnG0239600 [Rhododendron simsii]
MVLRQPYLETLDTPKRKDSKDQQPSYDIIIQVRTCPLLRTPDLEGRHLTVNINGAISIDVCSLDSSLSLPIGKPSSDAVKDGNWQKEEKKEEVHTGDDRVKNGAAAQSEKSYLQIVRGEKSKSEPNKEVEVCLKAEPAGNGWLHRSAVAILDRLVSMADLRVSCMNEIRQNVGIRAMGGRSILITFESSEIRDDIIQMKVMQRWFVSVTPWKNEAASLERFVWLSCSGMPLNAWNDKNFKLIGKLWGQYIQVDDKTLRDEYFAEGRILISTFEASKIDSWIMLDVDNMLYRVYVEEDDRFISSEDWSIDLLKLKSFEIPISDSGSDEEDHDDGDNNEDEDSQTDKLNGNDDNMEENKGKESNGILEDEAKSAILGTTIHQHNQHGDNTIKEGGGLDKDVYRVVDSMGLVHTMMMGLILMKQLIT